jgi:polyhydroxyalkanoate synthesis regulator phasin
MNWRQIEREHENIDRAVERGEMTPEEALREHRELDREVDDLYREERDRRGW